MHIAALWSMFQSYRHRQCVNMSLITRSRKAFSGLQIPLEDNSDRALKDCVWHGPSNYSHKPALYPIYSHGLQRLFQDVFEIPNLASKDAREHLLGLGRNRSSTMADVVEIYVHIKTHCADTWVEHYWPNLFVTK